MEEEAASLEIPHTHCPQEYTTPEDMEAGTNLLLNTILKLSKTENLD